MPFSLNMVLPQRVYEALSAVLVIIVASSVAHLPYAQWLVVRNAITLISMCEHEHTGSFQLSGMLRIVLLLSVFVAVPAPNPNIQEGVTDRRRSCTALLAWRFWKFGLPPALALRLGSFAPSE